MTAEVLPDPLPIAPAAGPLRGAVQVPGSKSVTNRALFLAALASGRSRLSGALVADDTRRLSAALAQLGASVVLSESSASAEVGGCAGRFSGQCTLQCGDGGTPARFLMAAAALANGPVVIDGSARLRERPMADGVAMLSQLGVECTWLGAPECLPVRIHAAVRPHGGTLRVGRTASSQFTSALLMVAPWLEQGLCVEFTEPPVSASYVELTISELVAWGARLRVTRTPEGGLLSVRVDPWPLGARDTAVEGDASSAIYWAAAAALVPGSSIHLTGIALDSSQPDIACLRVLGAMGAIVQAEEGGVGVRCHAPWPQGNPANSPLRGCPVDASTFPDGSLALMVAAATAEGPSQFIGLGTLRGKESDRIAAMSTNLGLLGCASTMGSDWLTIQGSPSPRSATTVLPTYNDHRIAMSFAVLGLVWPGICIANPACVDKSYPQFWNQFERLRAQSSA